MQAKSRGLALGHLVALKNHLLLRLRESALHKTAASNTTLNTTRHQPVQSVGSRPPHLRIRVLVVNHPPNHRDTLRPTK